LPPDALSLEKAVLLELLGVPTADIPLYHFPADPGPETLARVEDGLRKPLHRMLQAHIDSVGYIAQHTDLVPIGMNGHRQSRGRTRHVLRAQASNVR
jgi:hypothetical protein